MRHRELMIFGAYGVSCRARAAVRYAAIRRRLAPERPWVPRFPSLSREFGADEAIRVDGHGSRPAVYTYSDREMTRGVL
jgi:hypothetical protein